MSDPTPKMYVFAAAYRGRPALIVHTDDEHMVEDLWFSLLDRLNENAQNVDTTELWEGVRRDGLIWADESSQTDFRMPMQYPSNLAPYEAIAKLRSFAPEFEWIVEEADTSQRNSFPTSGTIRVSWREVAPADDDPLTRYAWVMDVDPGLDEEAVVAVLEVVAENAHDILTD